MTLAYTGNASRLYNCFRADLNQAIQHKCILSALAGLSASLKIKTAAVLKTRQINCVDQGYVRAQVGCGFFWPAYRKLFGTNQEPISRILRLSPQPIALSDIRRHPRLHQRCRPLCELLATYDMNDAFAIPVIDQQLELTTVMFAGRDLPLRPTNRHLLTLAATDVINRLQSSPCAIPKQLPSPQHLNLTNRQMEVASWLVAGKTDWEIGEILRISPKTVNFHVENIKRMYGVKSRNQFIAAIVHEGGLKPQRPDFSQPSST